jgi:hypothetical protein
VPQKEKNMSNEKTNTPKVCVTLNLPTRIPLLIQTAQAIEAAMSAAKATFPSPTPTMAQFSADIAALNAAEPVVLTRAKGAAQTRNVRLAIVRSDLGSLRACVQLVADNDPANAAAIAKAAGMGVRKPSSFSKPPLAATPVASTSGAVRVMAKAVSSRQSNDWQCSTDGGKTWIDEPATMQAKTTITGLTPATVVLVRHRAVTKNGVEAWSDPVSVLVH